MKCRIPLFSFLLIVLGFITRDASAHFLWLVADKSTANVYFSETADPGEPHLIARIAGTKAWIRNGATQEEQPLALKERKDDFGASLVSDATLNGNYSLEAVCDYGVVSKGEKPFLLQYYAKHVGGGQFDKLGGSPRLSFDIVPRIVDRKLVLSVQWQGKPVSKAEVVTYLPTDDQVELTTNKQGEVELAADQPGLYAIRARYVEDQAGERQGKKYSEVRHYATLTLAVPSGNDGRSAADLLAAARASRAVWNDFPGFSADVALHFNDEIVRGKMIVNEDGDLALNAPKSPHTEWLEEFLTSMIQHRMPDSPGSENVRYVDEKGEHPLGRPLALGDGERSSVYRIRDNVVTEVNRRAGNGRFTISVLQTKQNEEGKYLPAIYTITFWSADGEIRSSSTTEDAWTRIGTFDLPARTMQVSSTKDRRDVKLIEFSNHKLLK
jgi:hypothetical protein